MNKVLIDTSAWIDFFRSKNGHIGDQVQKLIEENRALLWGVVTAELIRGARGKKELSQLSFLFESIEIVPIQEEDWSATGWLLQELQNKGITLPLTDALISILAQRTDCAVLTLDRHFKDLPVPLME